MRTVRDPLLDEHHTRWITRIRLAVDSENRQLVPESHASRAIRDVVAHQVKPEDAYPQRGAQAKEVVAAFIDARYGKPQQSATSL